MRAIIILLVITQRIIRWTSLVLKKGSGTSLPGYLVEKYVPWILSWYNQQWKHVIYITGTNGKSSTRAMIVTILQSSGHPTITNAGGANILRGIASTLLAHTTLFGSIMRPNGYLILEVEEATLPRLTSYIQANWILVTNIVRDQLDLYTELEDTITCIKQGVSNCPDSQLILNGDDGMLDSLYKPRATTLALTSLPKEELITYERSAQAKRYPKSSKLYRAGWDGERYSIQAPGVSESIDSQGGISTGYMAVNTTLALSLTHSLGINCESALLSLKQHKPLFGRGEILYNKSTEHKLFLIKNPEGARAVLRSKHTQQASILIFVINNNIADGKDVSWLWDIRLADLLSKFNNLTHVYISGTRSHDIALCVKQVLRASGKTVEVSIESIEKLYEMRSSDRIYWCMTYTAMRQVRKYFERNGQAKTMEQE